MTLAGTALAQEPSIAPPSVVPQVLSTADAALYQAKRGGRNRVEVAQEEPLSLEQERRKSAVRPTPTRPSVIRHAGVTQSRV